MDARQRLAEVVAFVDEELRFASLVQQVQVRCEVCVCASFLLPCSSFQCVDGLLAFVSVFFFVFVFVCVLHQGLTQTRS